MEDNKVAVLLEDLATKFRTFGEGLELLNENVEKGFQHNHQEHQQILLMIQELNKDQKELKEKVNNLDQEFEIKLRRVK